MPAAEEQGKDSQRSAPAKADRASEALDELGGKASSGALWTVLGLGGGEATRFLSNLILTRLLLTEYFGLMAMVNVFIVGLRLFSDVGIGVALIQNIREDASFVNTVWTIQVVRGLALSLIALAFAGPYATFYDQPILAELVPVAAVATAISGFDSTSIFTERRHLHLRRPALLRLGAQLGGALVMVSLAWITRSVWSLVAGGIVTSAITMVLSHAWLPGIRNRFQFDRQAAHSILSFGMWIFLGTAVAFGANQLDRLILGKITTMAALGVYSIALMLALALPEALGRIGGSVLLPLFTRVHHSRSGLSEVFRTARWPLLVLGGWAAAGFIGGGPTIVRLLYDSRFSEAGWILQILAAGLWFGRVLGSGNLFLLLAVGRSQWTAAQAVSKVLAMIAFVPLGYWKAGFPGAVAALGISELVRYAVLVFGAARLGFDERRTDLRFTIRVAIAAFASWSTVAGLSGAGITNVVLHALVVFAVVTAFWSRPLMLLVARIRKKGALFLEGHEA